MKHMKHLLFIGLAAFLILGTGAVLAQDNGTPPPHWTGTHTHTQHRNTSNPTNPTPTPGQHHRRPQNDDHHDWQHHPYWQNYTYTAPLTCTLATRLDGQKQAEVAQTYSSLRAAIGSTDVLAVMPHGAVMSIIGGPSCAGGTYWYEVTYNGLTGWVTEGGDGEYWLEPVVS